MKKFATAFLFIILIAAVVGIAAYFIAKKYEPEVKDAVVYELNRKLAVEVSVEDINFSLLQRFPYASLRFSNVVIPEAITSGEPDTLLYAKDLYLQISLWDFLRKQYRISEAELHTGFFRVVILENGQDNYHFWKSSEKEEQGLLSINDVEVRGFQFEYQQIGGTNLKVDFRQAHAKGKFGTDVYEVSSECHLLLNHVVIEKDTLYQNVGINGELGLNINNLSKKHAFQSKDLTLGKERLSVEGHYNPADDNSWSVNMQAESAKIEHIIELLPLTMRGALRAYKAKGKTDILLEMNDSDIESFELDMVFDKTKGSFQHDVALGKAIIDKANGSLQIRQGLASLYIDHIHGSLGPGQLKMGGSIRNFSAPEFDLRIDGNVELYEVRNFFNIDYLDEMKGKVSLEGIFKGKLPEGSGTASMQFLKGIDFDGNINIKQGAFTPRGSTTHFEGVNGDISLSNNAFKVQEASAEINGNAFTFSGKISNALPYLVRDDQKLYITADFKAAQIDLNRLWNTSESKRDTSYQFSLPESIAFDFRLDVEEIVFRRFTAQNLSGQAIYSNNLLLLNPIQFTIASGEAKGSASVRKNKTSNFSVQSGLELKSVNVSQLFYAFENFGQEMVTNKHISGTADARVKFNSALNSNLSIDLASVQSQIELQVVKGKLEKVQALADVADYLRGNLVWRSLVKVDAFEKELASIDFDTLRNTIEIRNKEVYIPAMRVGSSALTLNLTGKHSFDNQIDYRLNFRLSELFKTGKPRSEEFGYIMDDNAGLRLFLQMGGTVDEPTFSLDKEGARQKRKDEFEREKNTFKGILKEEFGLFKSDSTAIVPPAKKGNEGPKFEVEWDEFEQQTDSLKTVKKRSILSPKDKKKPQEIEYDDDL